MNVENTGNSKIYVDYIIHQYPEDKTKVEPYSNEMQVKREVFEVLDESLLKEVIYSHQLLGIGCMSRKGERVESIGVWRGGS